MNYKNKEKEDRKEIIKKIEELSKNFYNTTKDLKEEMKEIKEKMSMMNPARVHFFRS